MDNKPEDKLGKIAALQQQGQIEPGREVPEIPPTIEVPEMPPAPEITEMPSPAKRERLPGPVILIPPFRERAKKAIEVEPSFFLEKTKILREVLGSHMRGALKYSAEYLRNGVIDITLKIHLPPDLEETFTIRVNNLTPDYSVNNLFERFRKTIVEDYVFKNMDKKDNKERKGLTGEADLKRIREIAQDIYEVFPPPEDFSGVGIA